MSELVPLLKRKIALLESGIKVRDQLLKTAEYQVKNGRLPPIGDGEHITPSHGMAFIDQHAQRMHVIDLEIKVLELQAELDARPKPVADEPPEERHKFRVANAGDLFATGWERPMTEEEEGCDTWHYPYHKRATWPEWAKKKYGGQVYWDLDEAITFQNQLFASAAVNDPRQTTPAAQPSPRSQGVPPPPEFSC